MFSFFKKKLFKSSTVEAQRPALSPEDTSSSGLAQISPDFLRTDFRFVAVDVETANERNHSICQIGLAMVDHSNSIQTYSCLINPREPFARFNIDLHGIDDHAVSGAPTFDEVFMTMREFLERHTLVQHSNFDRGAFDNACDMATLDRLACAWIDSVQIARRAWPEFRGRGGHGLANLKNALGLDFDHHDAGEDARAAAQVVLLAEEKLGARFDQIVASFDQGRGGRSRKRTYEKSVALPGNEAGKFFGQTVCFTGKLAVPRQEAAKIAAQAGLTVRTSVSRKLNILVVGDHDLDLLKGHDKSSKHRKAEELAAEGAGIRILGESEFFNLIGR